MDTDAIVKLTKAGAKGHVAASHQILLGPAVQREAIDAGKLHGYPDAVLIEENVNRGRVMVRGGRRFPHADAILEGLRLGPGEEDALRLFLTARADVVVSDDMDFLRRLRSIQVPLLTPAALLVDMVAEKAITREEGLQFLERLAPHIALEEYYVARITLGGKPHG